MLTKDDEKGLSVGINRIQKARKSFEKPMNPKNTNPSPQNKDALVEVWRRTLNKWNPFDDKVVKPALILVYSYPIPIELRSNVWFYISGARDLMKKNRNVFDHLTQISYSTKCIDGIEKDLKRTFMTKQINLKYENTLRRILVAYSNFDPDIGYTQGMNYIAGFILQQYIECTPSINQNFIFNDDDIKDDDIKDNDDDDNDNDDFQMVTKNDISSVISDAELLSFDNNPISIIEEKAFWTFVSIIKRIGSLFGDKLPGFHLTVSCFNKIFNYHAPALLVSHLNSLNVYPIMLSSWYHSLFTYPSMNQNITKRIWDCFFVENMNFSVLLKISYLIVIRHQTTLINMDFVEIIEFCKSNKCFIYNNKDDHDLIYRASKIQLNQFFLKPIKNLKYVQHVKHNNNNNSMFDNTNKTISSSSINSTDSSSISSTFVKLKPNVAITSPPSTDPTLQKPQNPNASKSWRSLLTFGFAK